MNFICEKCNRKFTTIYRLVRHIHIHKLSSKEYYDLFLKNEDEGVCICGKDTSFCNLKKGYLKHCSHKCSANDPITRTKYKETNLLKYGEELPTSYGGSKYKQNMIKKYGVTSACSLDCVIEKRRQTYLRRYGVTHPGKSVEVRNKTKKTCLEKYGVENPMQDKDIRKSQENTCLEKYGVRYHIQAKEVREKSKNTCLERYGVGNPFQIKEVKEKAKEKSRDRMFKFWNPQRRLDQSKKMLNGYAAYIQSFIKNPSWPQVKTFNMVKSIYPDAILNHPCLNYSLDIAIPSLMIDIEYDGSRYHQDKDVEKDKKRQSKIEEQGWKVIRYRDRVPSKDTLKRDIKISMLRG